MKSAELRNIKPVTKNKRKNILLINPKRRTAKFTFPHNGLAILSAILKKRGHEVNVIDYAFLFEHQNTDIGFFIEKFKPDIIGVSIYTPNANEANQMLLRIREINPEIPVMIGGPHATLYHSMLEKDKNIDYIFLGESELSIIDTVENAKREKFPLIIRAKEIVDIKDLPYSDYKSFYKWETMTHYPIMTSRGCPNKCSFCASFGLSYRRWRAREPEDCIRELEIAKKEISPHLRIIVFDDNPTVNKKRFHRFLDLYSKKIKSELVVVNTRADGIDETFLKLLVKCKVPMISIGVEHAHPEVYKSIDKGETLKQIEDACRLIKKHKLRLCLSFVIGLPGDNLERTKASINFCKRVEADQYSINQITPFRQTSAREWFEQNQATLDNEIGYEAQPLTSFECEYPIVETPDFTKKERVKAFYMFLFGVADPRLKLRQIPKILKITKENNLYLEFFSWLPRGIISSLKENKRYVAGAISIYKTDGFLHLLKRYEILRKQQKVYKSYIK